MTHRIVAGGNACVCVGGGDTVCAHLVSDAGAPPRPGWMSVSHTGKTRHTASGLNCSGLKGREGGPPAPSWSSLGGRQAGRRGCHKASMWEESSQMLPQTADLGARRGGRQLSESRACWRFDTGLDTHALTCTLSSTHTVWHTVSCVNS